MNKHVEINRDTIAALAVERQEENDAFRNFLKSMESTDIDLIVSELNENISASIDCTSCGACCRSLMINVEDDEINVLANKLSISDSVFKKAYVETGQSGNMIMNTIPCHFLKENKCTVYEQRFSECREFPHLHKTNFTGRLFGTLIHYAMCPIVFNVVEYLKDRVGFRKSNI